IYDSTTPDMPSGLLPTLIRKPDVANNFSISPDEQWASTSIHTYNDFPHFDVYHVASGQLIKASTEVAVGFANKDSGWTSNYTPIDTMKLWWLSDSRLFAAINDHVIIWDVSVENGAIIDHHLVLPEGDRTSYIIDNIQISDDLRHLVIAARARISDQLVIWLYDFEADEWVELYADELLTDRRIQVHDIQFSNDNRDVALHISYFITQPDSALGDHFNEVWQWEAGNQTRLETYTFPCNIQKMVYTFNYVVCSAEDHPRAGAPMNLRQLDDGTVLTDALLNNSYNGQNISSVAGELVALQLARPRDDDAEDFRKGILVLDSTGQEIAFIPTITDVNRFQLSPDASQIALVYHTRVEIVALDNPEQIQNVGAARYRQLLPLTVTPVADALIISAISSDQPADTEVSQLYKCELVTYQQNCDVIAGITSASVATYSPDETLLIVGTVEGLIHVLDAETYAQQMVLSNLDHTTALAVSHDGQLLAVTSSDNELRLWNLLNGQAVNLVQAGNTWNSSLLFTTDDGWLLYGNNVWKVESGGRQLAEWNKRDASEEVLMYDRFNACAIKKVYSPEDDLLLCSWYHGYQLYDISNIDEPIPLIGSENSASTLMVVRDDLVALSRYHGDTFSIYFYGIHAEDN
ncbi:MAG: WD40 repeat domain-containing protein, partial [Aggregatilineales bacterium]